MSGISRTHIVTGSRYWRITERVMLRRSRVWRMSCVICWVVWGNWRLSYIGGRDVGVLSEARRVARLRRRLELIGFRVIGATGSVRRRRRVPIIRIVAVVVVVWWFFFFIA